MKIVVVGISYQTSPIKVREQVSFSNQKLDLAYKELKHIEGIKEALILDTCNRTEIYAYMANEAKPGIILDFLINFHKLEELSKEQFYQYENRQAVDHLYRVAIGLDSMVLGEDQILGQVKTAYEKAMDMEMTGKVFHTLFRYVITGAKKIRNNIMGDNPPLSVSTIAIQFIKEQVKDFKNKKVFVLGVGKISKITIQNLMAEGVKEIFVANRTKHKARQLETFFPQIQVVPYEDRLAVIAQCHVTISSTSAPHYIVTKKLFAPYHKGNAISFVDLSLPRDIEPCLGELAGISIFTLDHLQQVANDNMNKRKAQGQRAAKELLEEQKKFWDWYICQPVVPTISFLQRYYTEIAETEIKSLMDRLAHLDEKDKKLIETVSKSMAKKLFNVPIMQMKECAKNGDSQIVCQIVEDLFERPQAINKEAPSGQSI